MKISSEVCFGIENNRLNVGDDPYYEPDRDPEFNLDHMNWRKSTF